MLLVRKQPPVATQLYSSLIKWLCINALEGVFDDYYLFLARRLGKGTHGTLYWTIRSDDGIPEKIRVGDELRLRFPVFLVQFHYDLM